jgi:two-component system chemotaxis response regulator CheY
MAMSKRILVVEDSSTVRSVVASALRGAGYDVLEAVDGADAIAKHGVGLAMILCDVNMPNVNGIDMLRRIRSGTVHPQVPVVMLTTEDDPGLIEQARAAGAKAWIVKPFKSEAVVATVRKVVGDP